jgi:hypothetical protein
MERCNEQVVVTCDRNPQLNRAPVYVVPQIQKHLRGMLVLHLYQFEPVTGTFD